MLATNPPDEVALVLGRILMDDGFRDLFQHDPLRAGAAIGLALEPATIARIHERLAKLNALDAAARSRFSSKLKSLERWKQV